MGGVAKDPKSAYRRVSKAADTSNAGLSAAEIEARYQATIKKQLEEIKQLREENATIAAKNSSNDKKVSEKDAALQELRQVIASKNAEIQSLRAIIDQMQREQTRAESTDPEVQRLRAAIVNMFLAAYGGEDDGHTVSSSSKMS